MLAALDRNDDLLGALFVVLEELDTVNPAVSSLLLSLIWLCADEGAGPPLELVLVALGEVPGTLQILRRSVDGELKTGEGVLHPLLDEAYRKMRDVNADPVPPQLLRRVDRRPASAERV